MQVVSGSAIEVKKIEKQHRVVAKITDVQVIRRATDFLFIVQVENPLSIPMNIAEIDVLSAGDWVQEAYTDDFTLKKVDSKKFGVQLDGINLMGDTVIPAGNQKEFEGTTTLLGSIKLPILTEAIQEVVFNISIFLEGVEYIEPAQGEVIEDVIEEIEDKLEGIEETEGVEETEEKTEETTEETKETEGTEETKETES